MNTTKRARKTVRLTADEFAEYMTIKTLEHLATMAPAERVARLDEFTAGSPNCVPGADALLELG